MYRTTPGTMDFELSCKGILFCCLSKLLSVLAGTCVSGVLLADPCDSRRRWLLLRLRFSENPGDRKIVCSRRGFFVTRLSILVPRLPSGEYQHVGTRAHLEVSRETCAVGLVFFVIVP